MRHVYLLLSLLAIGGAGTLLWAGPVAIGLGGFSGSETVLGFEEFTANVDVVSIQFAAGGVLFDSASDGGWLVEPYIDYGTTLRDVALGMGLGSNALFHQGESEEIIFSTPFVRAGFYFGSNVPINVPITVYGGGGTEGFNLVVDANQMVFFGYEDPLGINRITFGDELNADFVSQLDGLRFEGAADGIPEPSTFGLLLGGLTGIAVLSRRLRRPR